MNPFILAVADNGPGFERKVDEEAMKKDSKGYGLKMQMTGSVFTMARNMACQFTVKKDRTPELK